MTKTTASKLKLARIGTASLLVLLVIAGVIVGDFNYGGLTSLGIQDLWLTCPLGFIERSLASGELLSQWTTVIMVLLSVIFLGRIFCAWVCPTVILKRVLHDHAGVKSVRQAALQRTTWDAYSPYAILGGVLVASYVFKFPIFCFFCPIGLFFGLLFALIKPFVRETVGLELLVFPAVLAFELWGLKSWCRTICPLGALLSIVGNFNRFLLPTVRKDKCLTTKGVSCKACQLVCPEGIDLSNLGSVFSPNSCTKCVECYVKCPTKAIKWSIWA